MTHDHGQAEEHDVTDQPHTTTQAAAEDQIHWTRTQAIDWTGIDQDALWKRMIAKIDFTGPCWEWGGALSGGYGRVWVNQTTGARMAHRVVYEMLTGVISLDNLSSACRNRRCVDPDHMRILTDAETTMLGTTPPLDRARAKRQTHCKHGHEYTDENTIHMIKPKGYVGRQCRTCKADGRRVK